MAIWNVGPFDNDDAVSWCDRVEELSADQRAGELRRTLIAAADDPTRLSDPMAAEAVAAAAVVLWIHTGLVDEKTPYAPRFPIDVADDNDTSALRELARRALRVVMADGSPWRARWAGDIEEDLAIEAITELYRALGSEEGTASRRDLDGVAREETLNLCRAVRDAGPLLGLPERARSEILLLVEAVERSAMAPSFGSAETLAQVRAIRYLLVEVADGPVAALLADAASRVLGDDIGRLFS
ncbi:DUF4259 domain-containing protein [Actinoplanes sp. NPDC051494]|uniref:DUF4259 domain-containing protein n=1 Tax=Actinoplanes sp. NPDC051494 TaxID=3363907 RepID=UPI0037AB73F0